MKNKNTWNLNETNWNKIRIKNRLKQEMMKREKGEFLIMTDWTWKNTRRLESRWPPNGRWKNIWRLESRWPPNGRWKNIRRLESRWPPNSRWKNIWRLESRWPPNSRWKSIWRLDRVEGGLQW